MAVNATLQPRIDTFHRSARLLGVLQGLVGLGAAVLTAMGLERLSSGDFTGGALNLVAVLLVRWSVSYVILEWSWRASSRIRSQWRDNIHLHLRAPSPEAERARGHLALAIEDASLTPELEVVTWGARVAALGLVVVFLAAGWFSTTIILALLLVAVPFYVRAGRRSALIATEYNERRRTLEARQLEVLDHAIDLRALGVVEYGADEIGAISDSEHTIARRAIRIALESSLVTEFLGGVSIGLVAMVVGFELLGGRTSLLRALIAVLVTAELFAHVRRYGTEFHRREAIDRSLALLEVAPLTEAAVSMAPALRAVELVTEADRVPLTFDIDTGSRVLVKGRSGAGKTTLLQTLLGWRTARSGRVQRSGDRLAYVCNESALVSGTLRENLTLGVPTEDAALRTLLDQLGLDGPRFVDLDASLLADGHGFSSGERVRIVLARALLARPTVLMLDDIAGTLDARSRQLVRDVLTHHAEVAVLEATVDTPLLKAPTYEIVVGTQ